MGSLLSGVTQFSMVPFMIPALMVACRFSQSIVSDSKVIVGYILCSITSNESKVLHPVGLKACTIYISGVLTFIIGSLDRKDTELNQLNVMSFWFVVAIISANSIMQFNVSSPEIEISGLGPKSSTIILPEAVQ